MSKWIDHIEDYLAGRLPEDQKRAFESALRGEESLQRSMEEHRAALGISETFLEQEVRDELGRLKGGKARRTIIPFPPVVQWAAAVVLLGIIGFGIVKVNQSGKIDKRKEIALQYDIEWFRADAVRSVASALNTRDSAMAYFSKNEYELSKALWQQIDSEESRLYRARIAFRTGDYREALEMLDQGGPNSEKKRLELLVIYTLYGSDEARSFAGSPDGPGLEVFQEIEK